MRPLFTDLTAVMSAALVIAAFVALYLAVQSGMHSGVIEGMPASANLMLAITCGIGAWVFAPLTHSTIRRRLRRADRLKHG